MVKRRGGKRKNVSTTQDNDELLRAKAEYYGPSSSQTVTEDYYDPSPRYKYADAYKDCYTSPVASHSKVPRRSITPTRSPPPWRSSSPISSPLKNGNQTRSINLFATRPVTVHPKESTTIPKAIPTSPSEAYLALSKVASTTQADAPRKLLILDLNGTLLIRSSHTQPGRPRTSHPRAYLPSFVSYLFQDETMKWLDTMVWSSAMPHSVADMVVKAFPGERERLTLKAIWARDELGLGREEYGEADIYTNCYTHFNFITGKKTQTIKDLAKPWSRLTTPHSALSTLLLDDSSLKAVVQPYNHVVVPEYDKTKRNNDLAVWKSESAKHPDDGKYDQTLLAVIGILQRSRNESNIASWIRSGGLWAGQKPPDNVSIMREESDSAANPRNSPDMILSVSVYGDREMIPAVSPFGASEKLEPSPETRPILWYEHAETFKYWVQQGRSTLDEMNIEVIHGIYN